MISLKFVALQNFIILIIIQLRFVKNSPRNCLFPFRVFLVGLCILDHPTEPTIYPYVRPSLIGTFVFCRLFHGFYFVVVDSFVGFPGNGDGGGGSGVVVLDVCTSISPHKE